MRERGGVHRTDQNFGTTVQPAPGSRAATGITRTGRSLPERTWIDSVTPNNPSGSIAWTGTWRSQYRGARGSEVSHVRREWRRYDCTGCCRLAGRGVQGQRSGTGRPRGAGSYFGNAGPRARSGHELCRGARSDVGAQHGVVVRHRRIREGHRAGKLRTRIYAAVPLLRAATRDTIASRGPGMRGYGRRAKGIRGRFAGFAHGGHVRGIHRRARRQWTPRQHSENLYAWTSGADKAGLHILYTPSATAR